MKRIIVLLILFIIAFLYLLVGFKFFDLNKCHYDEGIISYGATRILEGDVPYRDFWTLYAPGHFYILAGLFEIFGISIMVERITTIIILSLIPFTIYIFLSRLVANKFSFLGFILSLIWLKSYVVYSRPIQPAMLFCVLILFPILSYIKTDKKIFLFKTGLIIGVTILFRQDFGTYLFIISLVVILLYNLKHSSYLTYFSKIKTILLKEFYLSIGVLLIVFPVLSYFYFNNALKKLINDTIIFTIKTYPKVRALPYPEFSISNIIFYIPFFVIFVVLLKVLNTYFRKDKKLDIRNWVMIFCGLATLTFFNYTSIRSEHSHLLPTMIPVILMSILITDGILKSEFFKKYKNIGFFIVTVIFSCTFWLMFSVLTPYLLNKEGFSLGAKRARGFYSRSELAHNQMKAIKFIQTNTTLEEKIFVANTRHDRVVNSDVMFYFLSKRDSATGYYELHPGVTDTKKVQQEIIEDIKRNEVKYIIQWRRNIDLKEPNRSGVSSEVFLLDKFISENYKIKKKIGKYFILCKKN